MTEVLPSSLVLVRQPSTDLTTEIPLRDPQGWLRPYKLTGQAAPREPVSCFIAFHPCVPGDPIKSHGMPGGDIILCLLTLANQWGHCSVGPKSLQGRQTIRANTYVFLWCSMIFYVMSTGQNGKHLSLKDCGISPKGEIEPPSHRLPIHPGPGPPRIWDTSVNKTCPLTLGGFPVPVVQSSLVNSVTLYLGSKSGPHHVHSY
jgi:hypothetical protein